MLVSGQDLGLVQVSGLTAQKFNKTRFLVRKRFFEVSSLAVVPDCLWAPFLQKVCQNDEQCSEYQ